MNIHALRSAVPDAPWDLAEEVELYAREYDRTGRLHFFPIANTWIAQFSLRSDNPLMRAYQEGRAPEPETEEIWIHELVPNGRPMEFRPIDIVQMGRSGLREFLQKGNLFSGRGKFRSLKDSVQKARDATESDRAQTKERARDSALASAKDRRRQVLGIPQLPVGIDLQRNKD